MKRNFYMKLQDIAFELNEYAPEDSTIFDSCHYFDGTLTYQGVQLMDLDIGAEELWNHWIDLYGELRIIYPGDNKTQLAYRTNRLVQDFILFNQNKYLGMMKALSIDYNPLASYDMTTISGTTTESADIHNTPAKMEVITSTTTDDSTDFRNLSKNESGPAVSGGSKDYSNTGFAASDKTLTWTDGDATGDFTTPQGNTTQIAKSHQWGTTDRPAQEFLEKEFEIRKWNILDEFFNDLNKKVLLSIWN